jgi:hypothetical protein
MGVIAQKVNSVLVKLDKFDENARKMSASMRNIASAKGF